MDNMFADLIPKKPLPPTAEGGNMFADLIPANQSQPQQPQIGVAEDVMKSGASGVAASPFWLGDMANAATQGFTRLAGTGYEALGGELTPEQAQALTYPKLPFNSSSDILPLHEPQTGFGVAANIAGGMAGAGAIGAGGRKLANTQFMQSQSSGSQIPKAPPLSPDLQPLANVLPEAAKKTGMMAKKPVPIESGLKANNAISRQYSIDSELQNTLYGKADEIGQTFNIKAPELYKYTENTVNHLKSQVAAGSDEQAALSQLDEILSSLKDKYGIAGKTKDVIQDPSLPKMNIAGEKGVNAYAISPNDAVLIKRVINDGLSSKAAVKAGGAKLLGLKSYVNRVLEEAGQLKPEYKKAISAAEKQAARMGIYRSKELRPIWNMKEDYVPWKAVQNGNATTAVSEGTLTRANKFLETVNSKNAGRASVIAKILPKSESTQIMREAIIHGKATKPGLRLAAGQAISGHPIDAAISIGRAVMTPQQQPLTDLAKQLKRAR